MSDPFDFGRRANRFAVMGNPVAHSRQASTLNGSVMLRPAPSRAAK